MTKPDQSLGERSPGDKDALGSEGAEANEKPVAEKKVTKKTAADKRAATAKASSGGARAQGDKASEKTAAPNRPVAGSAGQEQVSPKPGGGRQDTPGEPAPDEAPLGGAEEDIDAIVAEALKAEEPPDTAKAANLTSVPTDDDEMTKKTPTEDIFYLDMGDLNAIAADELTRVAAERDEYLAALQRLKADFDNNRKRTLRQQTEILKRANQGLLTKLLPVLDALDLAIAHASDSSEGSEDARAVVQIGTLLRNTLATEGLERIDAVNTPFDPTIHDAVAREPASDDEGNANQTVSNVMRAGYKLKGRVIRPAMVMVRG